MFVRMKNVGNLPSFFFGESVRFLSSSSVGIKINIIIIYVLICQIMSLKHSKVDTLISLVVKVQVELIHIIRSHKKVVVLPPRDLTVRNIFVVNDAGRVESLNLST